MNDIEILEKYLKVNNIFIRNLREGPILNIQELQAIENLIKENKEFKKIQDKLKEKNIPIETLIAEFERLENIEDELEKRNKKYIVQLTDEQYRKLVDIIRSEINKEWEIKVREIKIINDTNKPHIAQQKIREYFKKVVDEE